MIVDHRTTDEAYASASTTSDLTLRSHTTGAADVLIAAGMAEGSTLGHALSRLASERDTMARAGKLQLQTLRAWPMVVRVVQARIDAWQMDTPPDAAAMVTWWLDQSCPACHGTRWETVKGSNRQSNRACRACHGTGKTQPPGGEDGKRVANWMDRCSARYVASVGRAMSSQRNKPIDKPTQRL